MITKYFNKQINLSDSQIDENRVSSENVLLLFRLGISYHFEIHANNGWTFDAVKVIDY